MKLTIAQINRLVLDKRKADRFDRAMKLSCRKYAGCICEIIDNTDSEQFEKFFIDVMKLMEESKT